MDHQVNGVVERIERRRHRIDQERHVFVDDLDDGTARLPAMLRLTRVEHPELRRAGRALVREVPQRERGAVGILRAARQHVLGRHMRVELLDEALERRRLAVADPLAAQGGDALHQLLLALLGPYRHPRSLHFVAFRLVLKTEIENASTRRARRVSQRTQGT